MMLEVCISSFQPMLIPASIPFFPKEIPSHVVIGPCDLPTAIVEVGHNFRTDQPVGASDDQLFQCFTLRSGRNGVPFYSKGPSLTIMSPEGWFARSGNQQTNRAYQVLPGNGSSYRPRSRYSYPFRLGRLVEPYCRLDLHGHQLHYRDRVHTDC